MHQLPFLRIIVPLCPAFCKQPCASMQDSFLGFRAPAASWKYMQPRKKAPYRLVFFNLNLGIWEQWEVVSGNPWSHPWSSIHLCLRSRRLPNITLDLQVGVLKDYVESKVMMANWGEKLASGSRNNQHGAAYFNRLLSSSCLQVIVAGKHSCLHHCSFPLLAPQIFIVNAYDCG